MTAQPLPDEFADPRLAPYRELRGRRTDTHFVVEGELAVSRLLRSPLDWELLSVVGTASRISRLAPEVQGRCAVFEASHAQLRVLTGFDFHRGVLASAKRRRQWGTPVQAATQPMRVVVAHGIADPPNLGSIARNARAFGACLMAIDGRAADPFTGKALRASAGQIFDLPCVIYEDLEELEALVRGELKCELWAATLGEASIDVELAMDSQPVPSRIALVIGNEGAGLDPQIVAICDREVHVPMDAAVDSLNAAAASAVMLYALRLGQARALQSFAPK